LKKSHHGYGDELCIDEVFIKIKGKQYSNNRAEQSHEGARARARVMRKFKSVTQANRFLGAHKEVYNLFILSRKLISSDYYHE
jgi:transposase-like protein